MPKVFQATFSEFQLLGKSKGEDTGVGTGPVTTSDVPPVIAKGSDLSGTWKSSYTADQYEIAQSGSQFTWVRKGTSETAKGTVDGNRLSVTWTGGPVGTGSATATVIVDASGRATEIRFSNGAVFTRVGTAKDSGEGSGVTGTETGQGSTDLSGGNQQGTQKPVDGYWKLEEVTVEKLKEQSPGIYPAEFMGTRGNVTTKHWALEYGKVIMSQTVKWTWTDPPAVILPDQTVALTLGCEVVANGPKPPRRHLLGAIGADLAGYKVPQQYMGMGNFFDKNDPRKYQIGIDQGTALGKTVMTATKIVPGPFDLALEQKTPPVGRTIRVFVTHGARWVYSYNYLWVGGTPPSGAGQTTTSEPTKVLSAGGKTSWGTIYPGQSEGDVFQGGRWCNAKNGSDWLQRDFDGVYEISEIHIARAGTDVTTKGGRMVLKLQQPNGQWITVDELRETNVNFDKLSYGGKGNSIPAYQKLLPTPIAAKAFRLEFTGNGWFVAGDIKLLGRK